MDKEKLMEFSASFGKSMFKLIIDLVHVALMVIVIIGATAALMLLMKSYPELAEPLINVIGSVFLFLLLIGKIVAVVALISWIVYFYLLIDKLMDEYIKRRKKRRDEFISEIIKKLRKKNG